jgi:hypothetical protein
MTGAGIVAIKRMLDLTDSEIGAMQTSTDLNYRIIWLGTEFIMMTEFIVMYGWHWNRLFRDECLRGD